MRPPFVIAALLVAAPVLAEDPPPASPAPPDPELLEFLGEMGGENPELIEFISTRQAHQALKDAEKEQPKEDYDE
jgi:hypothetical protein